MTEIERCHFMEESIKLEGGRDCRWMGERPLSSLNIKVCRKNCRGKFLHQKDVLSECENVPRVRL
ncbi:hypothetical protein [Blautia hydrogenotrophica]|uniref:hypothetical protein n=1 Tax=Blautia hydrogenotrophica TaxID=53443 RepID=UPI003AB390F4